MSCKHCAWLPVLVAVMLGSLSCASDVSATKAPPASETPERGGILRLVQEAPDVLDPAAVESVYEALPVNQLFDGLVGIDPMLHVVPALATTWSISQDGRTYTFHLRAGVTFHDGSPLTADDVAFTLRRLLAPSPARPSIARSYLAVIEGADAFSAGRSRELPGVEVLDPLTVRIRLERPYLSFLEVLAMDTLRIVPAMLVGRIGDAAFARSPVGTGPFRLVSWDKTGLRLAANPAHFSGAPYLDEVRIEFARPDERDYGAARFDRGEVDVVDVSTDRLERLSRQPGVRLFRYQELSLTFLGLLTGAKPVADVRVRQAIAHAIDVDALVRQAPSLRRSAVGVLPPGMPAYSPDPKRLPYDPAAARRLLAEAGHPGGAGLPPVRLYTTHPSSTAARVLEQIRRDVEAVGIRLDVVEVDWPELSARTEAHSAPAFLLAWIADLPDPDSFLRTLFKSGDGSNYFDFLDAETDALLEAGAREMNPVERARLYREAERHILRMSPLVPLYHTVGLIAMRSEIRNLEPGPLGIASVNLEKVWRAAGRNPS